MALGGTANKRAFIKCQHVNGRENKPAPDHCSLTQLKKAEESFSQGNNHMDVFLKGYQFVVHVCIMQLLSVALISMTMAG